MKNLFTKQLKRKMVTPTLPAQFDKNFYQKLEQLKQQERQEVIQKSESQPTLYEKLLSLIAPLSFATSLGIFIILGTSFEGNSPDRSAQTQLIQKIQQIQQEEVFELSTLSDSEWDALISAAN